MATVAQKKKTSVESLHSEIVTLLEDLLDELYDIAEKNPGEHNVPEIQKARQALILFKPDA